MGCCHIQGVNEETQISLFNKDPGSSQVSAPPPFVHRLTDSISSRFSEIANLSFNEELKKASSLQKVAEDSMKRLASVDMSEELKRAASFKQAAEDSMMRLASVDISEELKQAASIKQAAEESMKKLERQATKRLNDLQENLEEAVQAVDLEKVGEFVEANIKDPLVDIGGQVEGFVRENFQATLDAIKDLKLKQRVSDIVYPIFRKIFVHSVHGIVEDTYEIFQVIGQGSVSTVRKAKNRGSGIDRAIKMITKNSLNDSQKLSISEETEILKSMDHPNIIQVIEIVEDTTKLNIVTELCTGGELFDRIALYKTFSENMAAGLLYQILSGLIHMHEHGIVHKDLKPENIMFVNSTEDYLKIIDFGIAQFINKPRSGRAYNGSTLYMAPEVSAGEISCKSDVWSCGVILFIMLGGRPPFVGKSEGETFSKIARGVFSFNGKEWAGVSKEAKALIQKMLTKDVAKRVTAEEAFNDPWVQNRGREMDNEISVLTLESLAGFRTTSKLQQATLSYIASNLTTCQEINELKKAFVILDENGDGRLSISELKNGFENLRLSCAVDIERIVQQCDMDNNGMIDYSEFITATLDWGKHLTQDMLEMAFKAYDTELCGSIGVEEIKSFLGGDSLYNDVWDQMLIDADKNEDGRIDLTEFKNLMLSAFKIN